MRSVSLSSPPVAKPHYRFGLIRGLKRDGLHRSVLGLFVMSWLLGSALGKPCCCQTATVAQASLVQATEAASAGRPALPPCCVQHAIAASRIAACDRTTQPCANDSQSISVDGLHCDCPCCISSAPAAVLHDQSLRIERSSEFAVIDWPSSVALVPRPEVNAFTPEHTGPPVCSAPERLAWLSRWIK